MAQFDVQTRVAQPARNMRVSTHREQIFTENRLASRKLAEL